MGKGLNASSLVRNFCFRHASIPLLWSALILALHAIPGSDMAFQDWTALFHVDKLLHAGVFAVLSCSVFIALGKSGRIHKYKVFALIGLSLFGVFLEFAQGLWFHQRATSIMDMSADFLGVILGRWGFRLIYG
jgi:hypothetical protein